MLCEKSVIIYNSNDTRVARFMGFPQNSASCSRDCVSENRFPYFPRNFVTHDNISNNTRTFKMLVKEL